MNIRNKQEVKRGHPCEGCPYVFSGTGKGCIMGTIPGDCAWYFYKRLMGHNDAMCSIEEIQKRYREAEKQKSEAEKQLEKGVEMLYAIAEMKYGAKYAAELRKKGTL